MTKFKFLCNFMDVLRDLIFFFDDSSLKASFLMETYLRIL